MVCATGFRKALDFVKGLQKTWGEYLVQAHSKFYEGRDSGFFPIISYPIIPAGVGGGGDGKWEGATWRLLDGSRCTKLGFL